MRVYTSASNEWALILHSTRYSLVISKETRDLANVHLTVKGEAFEREWSITFGFLFKCIEEHLDTSMKHISLNLVKYINIFGSGANAPPWSCDINPKTSCLCIKGVSNYSIVCEGVNDKTSKYLGNDVSSRLQL